MKIDVSALNCSTVRPGSYEFWCGHNLQLEVPKLMSLLKALYSRRGIRLCLHPEKRPGVCWLGEMAGYTPGPLDDPNTAELVLFTSGTTGPARPVEKTAFNRYIEQKRGRGEESDVWLLTYNPYRWAGISLLTHVLRHRSSVVVPRSLDVSDVMEAAKGATHVSLTPALFRRMLLQADPRQWDKLSFQQVTFGGESASQSLLDEARKVFPTAVITHTYASTEFGDICSASDGKEGFDVRKMQHYTFSEEGELLIEGKPTGDLWRLESERFFFAGRREDHINVGGNKVSLHLVADTALSVPGVLHAVARAVPSPLLGQVVSLEYVGTIEPRDLICAMRAKLPKFACPATVEKKMDVEITSTGKAKR